MCIPECVLYRCVCVCEREREYQCVCEQTHSTKHSINKMATAKKDSLYTPNVLNSKKTWLCNKFTDVTGLYCPYLAHSKPPTMVNCGKLKPFH